jgi:hypothetical protein
VRLCPNDGGDSGETTHERRNETCQPFCPHTMFLRRESVCRSFIPYSAREPE